MRAEDDDLLEGRAVRPAHRVRDEAGEADPLLRRVGAPRAGSAPCAAASSAPGRVERLPERARRTSRRRPNRRTSSSTGSPTVSPSSERRSLSTYAVPAGAVRAAVRVGVVRDRRELLEVVGEAAEHGLQTATASFGHQASMIAAPGSSILPSPFASSRLPFQLCRAASSICCARGARRRPVRSTSASGRRASCRRSCVAAAFIAETTLAGVCFFVPTFVLQQLDAVDRAVRPVVVGRAERRPRACCSS